MKLKKWLKICLGVLVIIEIIVLANNYTNKSINDCIKSKNIRSYCEKGLLK